MPASGTDLAYGVICRRPATQCPVRRYAISLRACYVMSGTEIAYGLRCLCACYAVCDARLTRVSVGGGPEIRRMRWQTRDRYGNFIRAHPDDFPNGDQARAPSSMPCDTGIAYATYAGTGIEYWVTYGACNAPAGEGYSVSRYWDTRAYGAISYARAMRCPVLT
eukprot:2465101-Rhodomonas_salina.2